MKCEDAIARIQDPAGDGLADLDWHNAQEHVAGCGDCRDALRGAKAMRVIRDRETAPPLQATFETVMQAVTQDAGSRKTGNGFWYGAAFGGAVAAALLIVAVTIGVLRPQQPDPAPVVSPEFVIALNEVRDVNVAIDAERDLNGATVSVFLSGGVELAGFGENREFSWTTDLARGVNQLTLPVVAIDTSGGTLVVQLDHEGMQRVFRIDLKFSG